MAGGLKMIEYPKINSIFKRNEKGEFTNEYSDEVFGYLANNQWIWTEKIDGTNVRIGWDGQKVQIGGRTDNAQIPAFLLEVLQDLFLPEKFKGFDNVILFGEGYGPKIQKGGGKYRDTPGFVLFDVKIGDWWLKMEDAQDIAQKLALDFVPIDGTGSLHSAIDAVRIGQQSNFGDFIMEGYVLKPAIDLWNRRGERVITKIKHKDRWAE